MVAESYIQGVLNEIRCAIDGFNVAGLSAKAAYPSTVRIEANGITIEIPFSSKYNPHD